MSLVGLLTHMKFLPERIQLQIWPPFLFMGVKVLEVSEDYRYLQIRLPLRWYGKNMHGTLFGGFMCAVSDPLPTLLCERIFKGVQAWTRENSVKFLRPAKGSLELSIQITDADIESIRESLSTNGQAVHTFEYFFKDRRGHTIAEVLNTVYLRRKIKLSGGDLQDRKATCTLGESKDSS